MSVHLDDPADARLSNEAPWAHRVVHVCTASYLGIRTAAACLPGHTLAISDIESLSDGGAAVLGLMKDLQPTHVVFHGMTPAIDLLARMLATVRPSCRLFGVYHGNLAQWTYAPEREMAKAFLDLDAEGVYERSHILKPGADLLLRAPAKRVLVNAAPRRTPDRAMRPGHAVLVPGTDNIRKNVYTNVIAAELSSHVEQIWHYAELSSPVPLTKARRLTYTGVAGHWHHLATASLVMNATVIDCHPMVDLEANAAGRVSLHGDYGLDLPAHDVEELQLVDDVLNLESIMSTLERALGVPWTDRASMAMDYARAITAEAVSRYEEFLDP